MIVVLKLYLIQFCLKKYLLITALRLINLNTQYLIDNTRFCIATVCV